MALQFQIGFSLDDKQLAQSLSGIRKDIENAFNVKSGMSKELRAATQQAIALEGALKKATTDKGISYASLTSELKKSGTSAQQLVTTLAKGGSQFTASLNAANAALALSNRSVVTMSAKIAEMARVFAQSFKFTAAQTAIRAIAGEVQGAVIWVKELNSALNEIATVTGKTSLEMERVTSNTITAARDLKVAASEYAEGALIFYQQGLSDDEVARRTEITVKAAKAANESIQDMSSQLTAIWNTYHMVGEEQAKAASVGARLAADTAVNFADIAEAMQVSAAGAAQMGVSYESLASIIATVGDTTQQSASVIGNAYKTIFSRMEQLKIEGTDGEVTLSSVSKILHNMGIEVLDTAGNLKELDVVIQELGSSWDSYSSAQKVAIAEQIGGTRQYTQFMALMDNYDKYLKNLKVAQGEMGETLEQQYSTALQSLEHRAEMAGEAWKRAFSNAIPEDVLKGIYTLSENLGNVVGGVIKGMGGLPGILMAVATLLSGKIVPSIKQAASSAATMIANLTPQGRLKSINKDFDNISKGLMDQRGRSIQQQSNATNPARQNTLAAEEQSLKIAQQKTEFSRMTAQINERINTSMTTASGEYKLQLQYAKQLLETAQNLHATSLDQAQVLAKEAAERQKTAEAAAVDARNQANAFQGKKKRSPEAKQARAVLKDREDAAAIEKMNADLAKMAATGKTSLEAIKQSFDSVSATAQRFGKSVSDLSGNFDALRPLKKNVDDARAAVESATVGTEDYRLKLDALEKAEAELNEQLKELADTVTEQAAEAIDSLGDIGSAAEEAAKHTREVTENLRDQTRSEEMQGQANEDANNPPAGDGGKAYSNLTQLSQGVVQLSMSLGMAYMAAKSFFSVMNDESATMGDKVGAVISLAATGIPAIAALISSIKTLQEVFSTAGIKIALAGKVAELGWGWIGLIAAAIAALIIAATQLIKIAHDNTPEAKMEKMVKAYEAVKDSATQANEKAQQLRDTINGYDSAISKLESCTRGTKEWRDALTEVNDKAKEVLNNLGSLSKEQIQALYTTENGYVEFNKDELAKYQSQLDARANAGDYATSVASYAVSQQNAANKADEFGARFSGSGWVDGQQVLDNLTQLMNTSGADFVDAINKMAGASYVYAGDVEKAKEIYEKAVEEQDEMADAYYQAYFTLTQSTMMTDQYISELQTSLAELQDSLDATAEKFDLLSRMKVDELLGPSFSKEIKGLTADILAENSKSIYNQKMDDYKNKVSIFSGSGNETLKTMLKEFNEAMGTNYTLDTNASRGYSNNRAFGFRDEQGRDIEYQAEYVAEQIAAYQALQQLTHSANEAATMLNQMDDATRAFVATGDLSGLTKDQFDELSGKVKDESGNITQESATSYLQSQGLSEELAAKYADEFIRAFNADFDGMLERLGQAGFKGIDKLTLGQIDGLEKAYDTITASTGEEFGEMTRMIVNNAGKNVDEVVTKLGQVDFKNWDSIEDFKEYLKGLDIDFSKFGINLEEYADKIQNANHAVHDVNLDREIKKWNELKGALENLEVGDRIQPEIFEKLSDEAKQYFVKMEDGTYQLTRSAEEFYNLVQDQHRNAILTDIDNLQQNIAAKTDEKAEGRKAMGRFSNTIGQDMGYVDKETGANMYNEDGVYAQIELIKLYQDELRITDQQISDWYEDLKDHHIESMDTITAIGEAAAKAKGMYDNASDSIGTYKDQLQEAQYTYLGTATSLEELDMLVGNLQEKMKGDDGKSRTSYDAYAQALIGLASQYSNTSDEIEKYTEALKKNNKQQREAAEDNLRAATTIGQAAKKYGLNADTLEAHAKLIKANNKEMKLSSEQAAKLAVANERMNKGVKTLNDNFKDWKKKMESADKSSQDFAEVVVGITDAVADLIGASDDFELPDGFLDAPENLKLLEEASNGSQLAINTLGNIMGNAAVEALELDNAFLQCALKADEVKEVLGDGFGAEEFNTAKDIVLQGIQSMRDHMQELTDGTMTLDEAMGGSSESWVQSLNQMAIATGMSVDEMNALLNSLGVQAKVDVIDVPQTVNVPEYTEFSEVSQASPAEYDADHVMTKPPTWQKKTWTVQTGTRQVDGVVQVAQISTEDNPITPSVNFTGVGGGKKAGGVSPSSTSGGGGSKKGGGGGGKKSGEKEKEFNEKDIEKGEELKERYANIQASIDKTTRALERLSDAADDAWGAQKYRNLKAITQQIMIQGKKLQALQKEVEGYLTYDQDELQKLLGTNGLVAAAFNTDGFVANRENIIAQLEAGRKGYEDEYNRLVNAYNTAGVGDEAAEEAIEKAKKRLEKFNSEVVDVIMKALDQVDETAQKKFDVMQERLEGIREWMRKKIEMAQVKLDIKLSIDDTEIRVLEHLIDLWGDLGTATDKNWRRYKEMTKSYTNEVGALIENAQTMQRFITNIDRNNPTHQQFFIDQFGEDAWNKYLDSNGQLPAEVIEQMQSSSMEALDKLEGAQEAFRNMFREYINLFNQYIEKFDAIADKIAANNETLDMYTNLMQSLGKDQTAKGAQTMLNIAKAAYSNAKTTALNAKAEMQFAKGQAENAQRYLDEWMNGRSERDLSENEAIMYQELKSWVDETTAAAKQAESDFKSAVNDMCQKMTEEMEATKTALRAALIDEIGGAFYDWDSMLDLFGQKRNQENLWLDDLTKNYELDKLGSKVSDYMNSNQDLENLQDYADLLEEINGLLESGEKMNETDLAVLQKRFELMQTMDQYEEEQNQKNTMRLQRDASGNYNYVYSSDLDGEDSKVDEIDQKVKDLKYEIEKLEQDAAEAAEEAWVETYTRIMNLQEETLTARYQNDEQYRKYIDAQLALETENLETYKNEIVKRYDHIDKRFEDSTIFWLLGEQELEDGTTTTLDNMEDLHNHFLDYRDQYAADLDQNAQEILENFQEDVEEVGEGTDMLELDFDNLEESIDEKTGEMIDENEALKDAILDLEEEGTTALDELAANIYDNAQSMVSDLDEVTEAVYDLIEALQALKREQLEQIEREEQGTPEPTQSSEPASSGPASEPPEPEPPEPVDNNAWDLNAAERVYARINGGHWPTGVKNRIAAGQKEGFTPAQVLMGQALINARYSVPQHGAGYGWTPEAIAYASGTAYPNLRAKYGVYTGGLISQRGTYELAERGPELVLNNEDTKNILDAVSTMRQAVAERALALGTRNISTGSLDILPQNTQAIQQQVQIEATFPGVSVAAEVEQALENLLRQVAQYNIDR